jgi:hypothetical protein
VARQNEVCLWFGEGDVRNKSRPVYGCVVSPWLRE